MPKQSPKRARAAKKPPAKKSALVRKALALIERRLDSDDLNTSVGDLIRLLEMTEKHDGPRRVEATFVDPEDFNE